MPMPTICSDTAQARRGALVNITKLFPAAAASARGAAGRPPGAAQEEEPAAGSISFPGGGLKEAAAQGEEAGEDGENGAGEESTVAAALALHAIPSKVCQALWASSVLT